MFEGDMKLHLFDATPDSEPLEEGALEKGALSSSHAANVTVDYEYQVEMWVEEIGKDHPTIVRAECLIERWLKNDVQRTARVGSQWMVSFMSVAETSDLRLLQAKQFFEKLPPLIEASGKANIGLQINFSCPNVGLDPKDMLDEVHSTLDSARSLGILTLIKLNALVPVEVGIDLASHEACDGIVMSNTIPWGNSQNRLIGTGCSEVLSHH